MDGLFGQYIHEVYYANQSCGQAIERIFEKSSCRYYHYRVSVEKS